MKKTARLSMAESLAAFEYINSNRESIFGMSEDELISDVQLNTGVQLTLGQLRTMTSEVGITLDSSEKMGHYIAIAIANRMSWPIGTLLSEGKKHEKERIAAIQANRDAKLTLKPNESNDTSPVQSPD